MVNVNGLLEPNDYSFYYFLQVSIFALRISLPNVAFFGWIHWSSFCTLESLAEHRWILDWSYHPEIGKRIAKSQHMYTDKFYYSTYPLLQQDRHDMSLLQTFKMLHISVLAFVNINAGCFTNTVMDIATLHDLCYWIHFGGDNFNDISYVLVCDISNSYCY